jgi:hypothetical protein
MTRVEIAKLACRILALWLVSQAVLASSSMLGLTIAWIGSLISQRDLDWGVLAASLIPAGMVVAMLLVALALWFGADRLARRMVSDDPTPVTRSDITPEDLMVVAFTAIGLFTLIPALRELGRALVTAFHSEYPFREWWSSTNWQADFWMSIAGLIFAIALLVGSRPIVRGVIWSRSAGTKPVEE